MDRAGAPAAVRPCLDVDRWVEAGSPATPRRRQPAYEERVDYAFFIRAGGRSGEDILSSLEERLTNPPEIERSLMADQPRPKASPSPQGSPTPTAESASSVQTASIRPPTADFDTGDCFPGQREETFDPQISIVSNVSALLPRFHMPLLLSSFAYSTCPGS